MCSILGILDIPDGDDTRALRHRALELSARMRHRGPDWSGVFDDARAILAHERLAIVDPENGAQPIVSGCERYVLAVNGEIYNHRELAAGLEQPYAFRTGSDCEVLMPLWDQRGADFLQPVNGIFAFVLHDRQTGEYVIGRDPVGVIPLYTGRDDQGRLHVASELKATWTSARASRSSRQGTCCARGTTRRCRTANRPGAATRP